MTWQLPRTLKELYDQAPHDRALRLPDLSKANFEPAWYARNSLWVALSKYIPLTFVVLWLIGRIFDPPGLALLGELHPLGSLIIMPALLWGMTLAASQSFVEHGKNSPLMKPYLDKKHENPRLTKEVWQKWASERGFKEVAPGKYSGFVKGQILGVFAEGRVLSTSGGQRSRKQVTKTRPRLVACFNLPQAFAARYPHILIERDDSMQKMQTGLREVKFESIHLDRRMRVRIPKNQDDNSIWTLFDPALIEWLADHGVEVEIIQGHVECWITPSPDFTRVLEVDKSVSFQEAVEAFQLIGSAVVGDKEAQRKLALIEQEPIPAVPEQLDLLCAQAAHVRQRFLRDLQPTF